SRAEKPALCRVPSYLASGLPRPAISQISFVIINRLLLYCMSFFLQTNRQGRTAGAQPWFDWGISENASTLSRSAPKRICRVAAASLGRMVQHVCILRYTLGMV